MSALISIAGPERAILFSDAAGYNNDGVLQRVSCKIETAPTVPFAITSHGTVDFGDPVKIYLSAAAESLGVDVFFDVFMPMFLGEMKERFSNALTGASACVFHLVAHSPTRGALHTQFQTIPEPGRPDLDIVPFQLRVLDQTQIRGPDFPLELLESVRTMKAEESADDYARYFGKIIMELMRSQAVPPRHDPAGVRSHKVGGHIDMTIVDSDGARTERIHTWPDVIGELIVPESLAEIMDVGLKDPQPEVRITHSDGSTFSDGSTYRY